MALRTEWYSRAPPYPSEPFTELKHQGKLFSGRRMPGTAELIQRRGNRMKAVLPVRIKGKDSAGKAFDELVHTLDVTASGARLGSVRHELKVGDDITIFYRQRRVQFRVVWTKKMKGTSEFQVGLQATTQDKEAWGLAVPEQTGRTLSQATGIA